jgi:hypothetical protein
MIYIQYIFASRQRSQNLWSLVWLKGKFQLSIGQGGLGVSDLSASAVMAVDSISKALRDFGHNPLALSFIYGVFDTT